MVSRMHQDQGSSAANDVSLSAHSARGVFDSFCTLLCFYFFSPVSRSRNASFTAVRDGRKRRTVGWKLVEITCTALDGRWSNHAQGHDLNGKHALSNLVQEQEQVE
jgi:hypothetical protein